MVTRIAVAIIKSQRGRPDGPTFSGTSIQEKAIDAQGDTGCATKLDQTR